MKTIAIHNFQYIAGGSDNTKEFIEHVSTPVASGTCAFIGTTIGGPIGGLAGALVGTAAGEVMRQNAAKIDKAINDVVFSEPVKNTMTGTNLYMKFMFGL